MKRYLFTLLFVCSSVFAYSQSPISIDKIINDLNWENCSEADVIFAFKDNIVKRDKDEYWDDRTVSSFILKNVKVGDYTSDANIIVNRTSRKLIMIGGISIGNHYDWSKGADVISKELEAYFSTFWGKEHEKKITYDTDFDNENNEFLNISCEWGNTYHNEKQTKGSFLIMQKAKVIVISIRAK